MDLEDWPGLRSRKTWIAYQRLGKQVERGPGERACKLETLKGMQGLMCVSDATNGEVPVLCKRRDRSIVNASTIERFLW